ncbi:uncharacterized protein HaLaN_03729, partial [Haematococcus lacustris]
VVENLLSPEGYKVEQAMSGSEALDFLTKTATLPDVILLDIMMPDMSGYEVCQEIRRRYSAVSIPIIMLHWSVPALCPAGSGGRQRGLREEAIPPPGASVSSACASQEQAEMESRKVTDMLKRMMPMSVIQRLQQGQSMIADQHAEVTVLFADLAGFWEGEMANKSTSEAVTLMNDMYSVFEKLVAKHQ